jgi:hypothetical protein
VLLVRQAKDLLVVRHQVKQLVIRLAVVAVLLR